MKVLENPVLPVFFRRQWILSVPFLIAMGVLIFSILGIIMLVQYPNDGITDVTPNGMINSVDQRGPAWGRLFEGDVILSIDNKPYEDTYAILRGKRSGDLVDFVVEREGHIVNIPIVLEDPSFSEIFLRMVPVIIALVFWSMGFGVQVFKPAGSEADLFFIWTMSCAVILTAGIASSMAPLWTSIVFNLFIWFIGPLSVHFHLHFPQLTEFKYRNSLLVASYTIAIAGALIYILLISLGYQATAWFSNVIFFARLYMALNLLIVVGFLFYNYRHAAGSGVRPQIRLVALGGGLAVLPFVTLTVLPSLLIQQQVFQYRFAFIFLIIIPLTYGYAIFRLHLIEIERHVNRGATSILIYSILGGIYLILSALLTSMMPMDWERSLLINTLLVIILASFYMPLKVRTQRFVDTIFYGGWYDYRAGVMQVTEGLRKISDLHELAQIVSERLVNTLNLEESCAFLRGPDGDFSVIEIASRENLVDLHGRDYPVLPRSSLTYLLKIGTVERKDLQRALAKVVVTPQELQLLNSEQIHLWAPIIGDGRIEGLLALGPKIGGDVYSGEDMDILRVLTRTMSPIIENVHLLDQLRHYAAELELRVEERTAELFHAKERVEAILASVGDGVIVTDLDGTILTVNAAFEGQSGYSKDEIIGRNADTLIDVDNADEVISDIGKKLLNSEIWNGELLLKRKSGSLYDAQLTIAPVCDQSGKIIRFVSSQRDITQQKELERMKDLFITDVSHELRTPTTNINLYLDLLENSPEAKKPQIAEVIRQQSRQLTKLVEDILDLSRMTKSSIETLELSQVDLNLLVEQVVDAYKTLTNVSGLNIQLNLSENLPTIQGNEDLISRMIRNIVANAVRYTNEGEVSIRTLKLAGGVNFVVQDNGIGIEPDDLPHIFDRFYRGQNVRQSNIHGSGLGLSIVKQIIDLHGGKVDVQSHVGKGSTFTVWLPSNME